MEAKSAIKPSDIIDWIISAISELEADGYQQTEDSQAAWRINGPPKIDGAEGNQMFAQDDNGDRFLVKGHSRASQMTKAIAISWPWRMKPMIRGPQKPPLKVGTVTTVDAETGEVVAEKRNAMTMLPPKPNACQECAVDHAHDQPHNQQSLYYQMAFHATHGRFPTWTDALAHCTPEVQAAWRPLLVEQMKKNKMPIPDDLKDPKPAEQ